MCESDIIGGGELKTGGHKACLCCELYSTGIGSVESDFLIFSEARGQHLSMPGE